LIVVDYQGHSAGSKGDGSSSAGWEIPKF